MRRSSGKCAILPLCREAHFIGSQKDFCKAALCRSCWTEGRALRRRTLPHKNGGLINLLAWGGLLSHKVSYGIDDSYCPADILVAAEPNYCGSDRHSRSYATS